VRLGRRVILEIKQDTLATSRMPGRRKNIGEIHLIDNDFVVEAATQILNALGQN
jgi:hypothetical protein